MIGDRPSTFRGIYKEAYEELLCTYKPEQIEDEMIEEMVRLIKSEKPRRR